MHQLIFILNQIFTLCKIANPHVITFRIPLSCLTVCKVEKISILSLPFSFGFFFFLQHASLLLLSVFAHALDFVLFAFKLFIFKTLHWKCSTSVRKQQFLLFFFLRIYFWSNLFAPFPSCGYWNKRSVMVESMFDPFLRNFILRWCLWVAWRFYLKIYTIENDDATKKMDESNEIKDSKHKLNENWKRNWKADTDTHQNENEMELCVLCGALSIQSFASTYRSCLHLSA